MAAANRSKSKARRRNPSRDVPADPSKRSEGREIDLRQLDPVNLDGVRRQVANLIANRALEVVQQVLDQIGRGNYQAMKYLFEIAGLFPVTTAEENAGENSLTKTLLNRLGISEELTTKDHAERGQREKTELMP